MLYSLYCQAVESKIPLDDFGLKPIQKKPVSNPICLDFIKTSDVFDNYENHQIHIREDYGYYYVENIALFEIFSGRKIVIKYFDDIDLDLIHILLNYPFAILFSQRKQYAIHAAAVLFNNKVFCFCGQTQSGKSSLASHIIKIGGLLISEDTCVFDLRKGNPILLSSYNFLKISDEVNQYNNTFLSNPIRFLKKSTNRSGYILDDDMFYSKPIKVDYFIYLDWHEETSNFKKLNNEDSLKMLLANDFIPYSKENALFKFKAASIIVNNTDHFLYQRTKKLETLDNFVNILLKDF